MISPGFRRLVFALPDLHAVRRQICRFVALFWAHGSVFGLPALARDFQFLSSLPAWYRASVKTRNGAFVRPPHAENPPDQQHQLDFGHL